MIAKIVVGLGFGDEGKGTTVDYLCTTIQNSIVVRFSGGQQAGHTVQIGDKKHIHSNFGSGTLRGIPTYFTEHCTIYPASRKREQEILLDKGVTPMLYYHPLAKITTPYDVAWNKINSQNLEHGTCGMGVGATMKRNESPFKLNVIDLADMRIFTQKLNVIHKYYQELLKLEVPWKINMYNDIVEKDEEDFLEGCKMAGYVRLYPELLKYQNVVFEGSQGILLDMDHGIFPNVTYANTTSKNAIEVCNKLKISYEVFYVTRNYLTRHGNGWLPEGKKITLINNEGEININNTYQGPFKVQELDYGLLRTALLYDKIYSGECQKSLVVTCMDQRDKPFDYDKLLPTKFKDIYNSFSPESSSFKRLPAVWEPIILSSTPII